MAEVAELPEPVVIPMLEQYTDDTSVLAQYLLQEIYRDYHTKRLVFIAAPERRLVPLIRWRKDMRKRINQIFDGIPGAQRDKLVFAAILSVSPAFIEALIYAIDDLWILMVGHLTANKSSIEFFARSRGVPWLRAVRELIPRIRRDPEAFLSSFSDHIVGICHPPNSITDEVLHQNLNDHGPDTFYLSMTGKIIPIEAPSYNDTQPEGLQIIDTEECIYDYTLFSQYTRTPNWTWQTWPRHPQICDDPDLDGVSHERDICERCDRRFSGEEEWHDADIGCQCRDILHPVILIQIVEYPPFPNQPDVVNRGVRALESFEKDVIIGEYTGVLLPKIAYDADSEICDNTYLFGINAYSGIVANISARLHGNWTRFINHADDEAKRNVKFSKMKLVNRVRVLVRTTKEIKPGEELLGDYGPNYFQSRQF